VKRHRSLASTRPPRTALTTRAKRERFTLADLKQAYEAGHRDGEGASARLREALHRAVVAVDTDTVDDVVAEEDGRVLLDEIDEWLDDEDGPAG